MDGEYLWTQWVLHELVEGQTKEAFLRDLNEYYDARIMTEARKFLEVIKEGKLEGAPL